MLKIRNYRVGKRANFYFFPQRVWILSSSHTRENTQHCCFEIKAKCLTKTCALGVPAQAVCRQRGQELVFVPLKSKYQEGILKKECSYQLKWPSDWVSVISVWIQVHKTLPTVSCQFPFFHTKWILQAFPWDYHIYTALISQMPRSSL